MKPLFLLKALLVTGVTIFSMSGETAAQHKAAVLAMDSKGIILDQEQLSGLLRIELEKTKSYKVMDKYDVQNILSQRKMDFRTCLSRTCLAEAGKALEADKVFSGSVERYDEKLVITLRIVDVKTASDEKTQVSEFLNLQPALQEMIGITLNSLLGIPNEEEKVRRLSRRFDYESAVNNPGAERLKLNGPRMGLTFVTGEDGQRITEGKASGGFDAFPVMSQFGYQFETQYLNHGNFQALVEIIPTVTGIDQGFFIPNLTMLNGFRNNRNGFEFAFGPSISFARILSGYYENGVWHPASDWQEPYPNPYPSEDRLDSRGDPKLRSGFVFAIGKTFKSGDLNIPVNVYIVPGKTGMRMGASFGFNLTQK
jgi:hypothetical protein